MKKVLVSGTFDPPTLGHLSIIKKCTEIFDTVVVCVFVNPEKKPLFTVEERIEMISAMCKDLPSVTVDYFEGMLADYARQNSIEYVARGIRDGKDAEYELFMAEKNKEYNEKLNTVFFPAEKDLCTVSSTQIRDNIDDLDSVKNMLCESVTEIIERIRKES